jgi:hypothetical protein
MYGLNNIHKVKVSIEITSTCNLGA